MKDDNFDENKKFAYYTVDELIWAWPEITDEYFDDVITVLGHTPTMFYDHANKGKRLKTKACIDIDVGVQYGNPPALLPCLMTYIIILLTISRAALMSVIGFSPVSRSIVR